MTRNSPKRIILIVALSIMATTGYMKVTEANAISYLEREFCDYVFSEYAFTQIDRADYPRCEKRFDYLTKRFQSNFYSV